MAAPRSPRDRPAPIPIAATLRQRFPAAAAVGFGVVLSLLLQLNQETIDLKVVRLTIDEQGRYVEHRMPAELPSDAVIILDVCRLRRRRGLARRRAGNVT